MIDLSLSLVYDKTLRTVLKAVSSLLYPMSNNSGGKSRGKGRGRNRSKAKQKAAVHQLKGHRRLLFLALVVLSIVGRAFSESVKELAVEGGSKVC